MTTENKGKKKIVEQVSPMNSLKEKMPLLGISFRFLGLAIILFSAIFFCDKKGYFNADERNNHTKKKWTSFYEFSKKNNVDVLLVGNSHLYTGINPKNLSTELGANSFILASPGTHIGNTYFALKDALTKCDPSVVVIETYGIKAFDPHKLSEGMLTDQMKSYSARKNMGLKLLSTPALFNSENYLSAWSTTIRNHDFIYTNREQLKKNKELIKNKDKKQSHKLNLGRYVRFTTGIEEDILKRYKEEGAPVDGENYTHNKYTEKYVQEIVDLCADNEIELVFLTLPMYHAHVKNYETWKNELGNILNKYPNKWLDMQSPYDYKDFTENCFENSYKTNQHMTYQGSLIATYKLASSLREWGITIPRQSKDRAWHVIFYGQEGYFQNFSPIEKDQNNKVIIKDLEIGKIKIKEISLLEINKEHPLIQTKIDRDLFKTLDPESTSLELMIEYKANNKISKGIIALRYDKFHKTEKYAIFSQTINSIEVLNVLDANLVKRQ